MRPLQELLTVGLPNKTPNARADAMKAKITMVNNIVVI